MAKSKKRVNAPAVHISDYENRSPLLWSVNNVRLPKGAKWDFKHRRWQTQIFDDMSREVVVRKPTQVGMTIINVCKYFYFASRYQGRLMYTLPRQDDVTDLVNSRVDEMIHSSPYLASRMTGVNNVRMKKIGDSYLHFMEASVTPRMLDVDYLVNDEVDLSDMEHLEQYVSRLDASDYGFHHRLSTPTIYGYGIDALYELSDQKKWIIKCPRCSHEFDLSWEDNVVHKSGDTWYACSKCDKSLDIDTVQSGVWVSTGSSSSRISGYSVNQMMCSYIPPDRLWNMSKTMKQKNFYNLRLGVPYTPTIGNISSGTIYEKCFDSGHSKLLSGDGCVLGCDQGNDLFVTIAKVEGDVRKIVWVERIDMSEGFDKLEELIVKYGVRRAVIDALPNHHNSLTLAKRYPGRVSVAYYSSGIGNLYKEDRSGGKVHIRKHDSFDYLKESISGGKIQFYGEGHRVESEVRTAIRHLSNMRRDEVSRRTRSGGEHTLVQWVATGPDHYADSVNYLNIAADMIGGVSFRVVQLGEVSRDDEVQEPFNVNPHAHRSLPMLGVRHGRRTYG